MFEKLVYPSVTAPFLSAHHKKLVFVCLNAQPRLRGEERRGVGRSCIGELLLQFVWIGLFIDKLYR